MSVYSRHCVQMSNRKCVFLCQKQKRKYVVVWKEEILVFHFNFKAYYIMCMYCILLLLPAQIFHKIYYRSYKINLYCFYNILRLIHVIKDICWEHMWFEVYTFVYWNWSCCWYGQSMIFCRSLCITWNIFGIASLTCNFVHFSFLQMAILFLTIENY